nr:MAG TPA: hypothetical protein [Caudoviricetes sp.]DAQ28552.1 MAG TPA: hypothetical protein [Caudoviricetes sp.]
MVSKQFLFYRVSLTFRRFSNVSKIRFYFCLL